MRILVAAVLLSACGGSSAGTLDCSWITSYNCWKMTLAGAAPCLPYSIATGAFTIDRQTCSYSTGEQVSFTSAIPNPVPPNQLWNFTLASGSQACIKLEQPDASTSRVTTLVGTVTATISGAQEIVTCPDGQVFSGDAAALSGCGTPTDIPGQSSLNGSGTAMLSLLGASTANGAMHIFTCQ